VNSSEEYKALLEIDYVFDKVIESKLENEESFDLEMYGHYLSYLEQGKIVPKTDDEISFVKVMAGSKEPSTKFEKLWVKFRMIRQEKNLCKKCIGKGFYISPRSGNRHTCEFCHGAGIPGATTRKITPDGTY